MTSEKYTLFWNECISLKISPSWWIQSIHFLRKKRHLLGNGCVKFLVLIFMTWQCWYFCDTKPDICRHSHYFPFFSQYLLTRRVHTANVHLLLILALNLYAHMWILSVYELFVSTTYSHSSLVEILNSKDPSISFPSKMEMSYFNGFLIENWADGFECVERWNAIEVNARFWNGKMPRNTRLSR